MEINAGFAVNVLQTAIMSKRRSAFSVPWPLPFPTKSPKNHHRARQWRLMLKFSKAHLTCLRLHWKSASFTTQIEVAGAPLRAKVTRKVFSSGNGPLQALMGMILWVAGTLLSSTQLAFCGWFSACERDVSGLLYRQESIAAEHFSQGGWPKAQAPQGIQDVREGISFLSLANECSWLTFLNPKRIIKINKC